MTHAKNNEGPRRSRPSENPATAPTSHGPFLPHSTKTGGETTTDRTDTPFNTGKEQEGLPPVERAALELSTQRHERVLDLLARH